MHKRFTFLAIILTITLALSSVRVMAQDKKPGKDTPVILVTTATDAAVILTVSMPEDGSGVWIETAPGQMTQVDGEPGVLKGDKYYVNGTTVKVYGAIKTFACSQNEGNIKEIDCSGNPHLVAIFCSDNQLKKLVLTGCTKLRNIQCYGNDLTELNTRGMKDLSMIEASRNQLKTIDLSESCNLTSLEVFDNQIKELKVAPMPRLEKFDVGDNEIAGKLDLSASVELRMCNAEKNQITEVQLPESAGLCIVYLAKNRMDDCALNKLYKKLNSEDGPKKIEVVNNPGVVTSDTKIARDKGWEIDVEGDGTGCKGGENPDALEEISSTPLVVSTFSQSGYILVQGAQPHTIVKLYDMAARLLLSATTDAEGKVILNGSNLRAGNYLLMAGMQNTLFTFSK